MATEVVYRETRRRYRWPEVQLNLWIFIVLAGASTVLGINAWFISVQQQLRIGIPWLFTFAVVTGGLTIIFLVIILVLAARRMLIPGGILLGAFILLVLWVTVLIETAIQLYGRGNVNGNCNNYVTGQEYTGVSIETLAWLTQDNICSCWKASFAWSIILAVLFLWMMVLSYQVQNYD
ncbi:uncharacterized protein A1O9_00827 [Exophiala aquamarina CBS 119918]|uniref:MARVEL domain-containing protein n=1 Tax=Exophiala aquamarina CBS 119918 TaxID=1182545 RepID=A0A072PRZ3_9EURO|nr:uncharacterized protein A1O9_00827 [Exophiala aquamarina CBS 119918]KEF62854.1 hypothetical protein A1O9_00827 [Exophiala aquamarina CBS 119918]